MQALANDNNIICLKIKNCGKVIYFMQKSND